MKSLAISLVALCFVSINLPAQTAASSGQVIAEIGTQKITAADLEQGKSGTLLQARFQYYMNQRKALDELIDDQLITAEARKQNISVDQLLTQVVYKTVKDPTEDQLQVYYEGLDTQQPYEAVRSQVLEHIRSLRRAKARASYVADLRKKADITVLLMPPVADVNISNTYIDGSSDAQVMLVEFADYECPYCQKVSPQLKQLKKEYGSKLAIAYKDMPLPMHQHSEKAAEAARCAGEQGKFWEYHDALYSDKALTVAELKEHARSLQLNGEQFDQCLDSNKMAAAVKKDLEEGNRLGLTGTPSFFVNDHFFSGALDYAALKQMVEQQLAVNMRNTPQTTLSKR